MLTFKIVGVGIGDLGWMCRVGHGPAWPGVGLAVDREVWRDLIWGKISLKEVDVFQNKL